MARIPLHTLAWSLPTRAHLTGLATADPTGPFPAEPGVPGEQPRRRRPCPAPGTEPHPAWQKNTPGPAAAGLLPGCLPGEVRKAAPGPAAGQPGGNEPRSEQGSPAERGTRTSADPPCAARLPAPPGGPGSAGPGGLRPPAGPAPALPPALRLRPRLPPPPAARGPARPRRPGRPAPAPLGPSPPAERRRAGRRLPPAPRLLHWQPPGIPTIARLLGASSRSPPRPRRPGPARPFAVTPPGARPTRPAPARRREAGACGRQRSGKTVWLEATLDTCI